MAQSHKSKNGTATSLQQGKKPVFALKFFKLLQQPKLVRSTRKVGTFWKNRIGFAS